jgi:hypothetical protein
MPVSLSVLIPGADERIIPGQTTPGRVFAVLTLACVVAAIFTSEPLLAWVDSLPDTSITTLLHDVAQAWNDAMTAIGATKPYHALHDLLRAIEAFGQ